MRPEPNTWYLWYRNDDYKTHINSHTSASDAWRSHLHLVSWSQDPQLAKAHMEGSALQPPVWLLHHKHIDGPREVGCVQLLVEAATGGHHLPEDIHSARVRGGEPRMQYMFTQARHAHLILCTFVYSNDLSTNDNWLGAFTILKVAEPSSLAFEKQQTLLSTISCPPTNLSCDSPNSSPYLPANPKRNTCFRQTKAG